MIIHRCKLNTHLTEHDFCHMWTVLSSHKLVLKLHSTAVKWFHQLYHYETPEGQVQVHISCALKSMKPSCRKNRYCRYRSKNTRLWYSNTARYIAVLQVPVIHIFFKFTKLSGALSTWKCIVQFSNFLAYWPVDASSTYHLRQRIVEVGEKINKT